MAGNKAAFMAMIEKNKKKKGKGKDRKAQYEAIAKK